MSRPHVLVVEDDAGLRRIVSFRLGRHYDVAVAADGKEALAHLARRRPDLVVSDIFMPVMGGLALRRHVAAQEGLHDVPFLFVSAVSDTEEVQGTLRPQDACLVKPFDGDVLEREVARLLGLAEGSGSS